MRSENTHPVAHPFRGEAFPLLASSVFLSPRWRLTVTGSILREKIRYPSNTMNIHLGADLVDLGGIVSNSLGDPRRPDRELRDS